MATGHILPGYGNPVTRLRRAQSAYPLDKQKLKELAESNVGTLERGTLESIRNNARNMWMSPNYAPTTYNSTHNHLVLDEPTQGRPTSPSRHHNPHPKPVFLINRLHYVPGYHNPDASMGKDVYRIDDTFQEEERQLRRHQREKFKARPRTAAVDQYMEPYAPLTDALGPVEAWGAQAWLKTTDDDNQHNVVNAIRDYRDQDLIDISRNFFDENGQFISAQELSPELLEYLLNCVKLTHQTDYIKSEESQDSTKLLKAKEKAQSTTKPAGSVPEVTGDMSRNKAENKQPNKRTGSKGVGTNTTVADIKSNENRTSDGMVQANQMSESEELSAAERSQLRAFVHAVMEAKSRQNQGKQTEATSSKHQKDMTDQQAAVEAKWRAWQEKYQRSMEKHAEESTWKNKITDVSRNEAVPSDKTNKYSSDKNNKVTHTETKTASKPPIPAAKDNKSIENQGKTAQDNGSQVQRKSDGAQKRPNTSKSLSQKGQNSSSTVSNKLLFRLVSGDNKTCEQSHKPQPGRNIKQRPHSASYVRPGSRQGKVPPRPTPKATNTTPQDSFFDIDQMKSEAETMRKIIDKYVIKNADNGEFLHWTHGDNFITQSPVPPPNDASLPPPAAIASSHRWMKPAGVRESESVRRIMYGGYPPSTIQPLGSLGNPSTLRQRRNQDIHNVSRARYTHTSTRGDFLIHPEWPPTFLHHRID